MFRSLCRTATAIALPLSNASLFNYSPTSSRLKFKRQYKCIQMGTGSVNSDYYTPSTLRLCNVNGHMTEILEIKAPNPILHVLFIPGNPGIITFYEDFVESLYELLEGRASVTAVGHISHSAKDLEHGRLFSLEEQIIHKMDYVTHELQDNNVPLVLVGHSVGSYISVEMFKRASQKVSYCVGLYPFLALNTKSSKQTAIKKLAESPVLCSIVSSIVALLGLVPSFSRFIVKRTIGSSWSEAALGAACSHLLKYHTLRNVLFMAMTEFQKFSEAPDWNFLKAKQEQMAFLFGIGDHWGPLSLFEEISKHAPDVSLSIEREGHDHAYSCTVAGSRWVAQHVASLIQKHASTKATPTRPIL